MVSTGSKISLFIQLFVAVLLTSQQHNGADAFVTTFLKTTTPLSKQCSTSSSSLQASRRNFLNNAAAISVTTAGLIVSQIVPTRAAYADDEVAASVVATATDNDLSMPSEEETKKADVSFKRKEIYQYCSIRSVRCYFRYTYIIPEYFRLCKEIEFSSLHEMESYSFSLLLKWDILIWGRLKKRNALNPVC